VAQLGRQEEPAVLAGDGGTLVGFGLSDERGKLRRRR
jgi:hypothetical protein